MPEKIEALGILLVLLPGFCCAYLIQQISIRRKQSEFEKIIEALLFTVILFIFTLPFYNYVLPISWISKPGLSGASEYSLYINWSFIRSLIFGSLALALLYALNINYDWVLKLLRLARITDKTARSSIWNDAFQDISNCYLKVEFADGREVIGYLRYYSDDPEDGSLFLEDAAWIGEDGEQIPINGPGILLTKESKIVFISFLNPDVVPS